MKKLILLLSLGILCLTVLGFASTRSQASSVADIYVLPFAGTHPVTQGPMCNETHYGTGNPNYRASAEAIDFGMPQGTPIYSSANGTIMYAGWDTSGFGNLVKIQHPDTSITYYAHLLSIASDIAQGVDVVQNKLIGYSGDTTNPGVDVGNHLHFERRTKENLPIWIRTLSGISWISGDPNSPCSIGPVDGDAYAPGEILLYTDPGQSGSVKDLVFFPNDSNIYNLIPNNFDNATRSIHIRSGFSIKVSESAWGATSACLAGGEYADLGNLKYPGTNISLDSTISLVQIFDDNNCGGTVPPPEICSSSSSQSSGVSSLMVAAMDSCTTPLPNPTPTPQPGVTPTPGPTPTPSQSGSWNVKVFSAINECNDSADCNPPSSYYSTSISGQNFNLNFSDGKPFGTGGDQWGMFLKQTVNLSPGTYYIHADHDDGVKVWVNGAARMDVLGNSENNTTCPGIYLSGNTSLSILWKNTGGSAHLNFSIDQNGYACQSQQKWTVKYYHDPNLCSSPSCNLQQVFCETEAFGTWFHIDPYPGGTPCGDGDQTWGSIWKQTINFPEGNYVFWADHDDGVKIFLGDTNIMDVAVNEMGSRACPARHLNGNVPVTVIHSNTGGDARINVSWTSDTSACEQVAYNVWVWKDSGDVTHVKVENGDINKVNLYLGRSGHPIEITRARWFSSSGGIEALIPADADSFLVDQGFVPTIDGANGDEWYNDPVDGHWIVRKKMFVWIDDLGQTRLTYQGDHSSPLIRYYESTGGEQMTTSLWYELADGSGIEAIVPATWETLHVDKWIRPVVLQSASTWWVENNYWLPKRVITVVLDASEKIRVNFYWGLPLPVSLGRYGMELETRSDLWQSEVVNGHTNYYMFLPDDVVAFEIQGGPVPRIDDWANWFMDNSGLGHWVVEKTTWVYRSANNETMVYYSNPDVNPVDVNLIYYLYGDSTEHQTVSWWTKVDGGLILTIPRDVETFLLSRGPAPVITDQALPEWRTVSNDGKWINRKPIRVWIDQWGRTYVTYWHEQTLIPNLHYVLNGTEAVTTALWVTEGDGIQARIPDGATHFLVEVNNQPYLETSAATTWKFSALPDLWIELINMPTPTPTAAPTATGTPNPYPGPTETPVVTLTPTIVPSVTVTPTPVLEFKVFLPLIMKP